MVIISLEVNNFKSYKGHHLIGPFKQFSCVIGPNGSGKSNLMEAIIFVLGYKSSQIRGSNLTDLVFKPMKSKDEDVTNDDDINDIDKHSYVKMNYHYKPKETNHEFMRKIILQKQTIVNKETKEEIEKEVAQSQYYIDGELLKFEEYEKLLSDFDVHVACKNFFVFQGDVVNIASQNPKHITALIEQVSGSGELKAEYESKLQAKRVAEDDVLLTYSKKKSISAEKQQINAQLAEAREFREFVSKQDAIRGKMILLSLRFRMSKINELSEKLLAMETQLIDLTKQSETLDVELKQSNKKQAETHKQMIKLEDELETIDKGKDHGRPGAVKISEEIKQLNDRISKLTHFIERAEKNHSAQIATIDQLRSELLELERQETALDNEEIAKKIDLTKEQMEQYNAIKLQAGKDTSELKKQVDTLTRQQNIENASLMTQEAKKEDFEKMKTQLTDANEKMQQRLEVSTQVASDASARLELLKDELKLATTTNQTVLARQNQITAELDRIQFIMSEDKSERNEKDKDKRMNMIIASLKNLLPDVRGRLSDLCEHTQKKYATAAAVAMGKLNDAIVVDTQKSAYTCVEYMKEQLYGTATFLPLDRLSAKPLDPKLRQIGGTSKLLIDCLKFDKSIESAVRYVVGNTLVCDTLNEAKQLAFGNQYERHKVVTIQGIKITKSGLMSGGLMGVKTKTKLDDNKIEELKKQREALSQELATISGKLVSISDIQVMNNQINEMTLTVNTNKITMSPLQDRIDRNLKEISTLNKELAKIEPEIQKLKKSIAARQEEIDAITFDINAVEEELFKDLSSELGVKNIKEFEEERLSKIQQVSTEKMALSQSISRIRNQLEYESSRNLEAEIQSLRSDLEMNQESLEKQMENQEDFQKVSTEIETKSKDLSTNIKSLKATLVEMNTAIKEIKKKISDNNFKRGQIENQTMVGLNEIKQLKKDYHKHLLEAKTENIRIPLIKEDEEMKEVEEEEEEGKGEEGEESEKKKKEKKSTTKKQEKPKQSRKRKSTMSEQEEEESGIDKDEDLEKIYHDSDDEEFDSDDEDNLDEEVENTFGSLVELPPDVLDPEEEDEFFEKHLSIKIDFSSISDITIKTEERLNYQIKEFSHDLHKIKTSMENFNPNLKAYEHSRIITNQLKETIQELEKKREIAKQADQAFAKVKKDRTQLFNRAFDSISRKISKIYSKLTRDLYPPYLMGSAKLSLEDTIYPFNSGVKYSAIPPNKRWQEMDQLSGGEKSIAALALLFAIHRYKPTPFFILDEVDAAFDNINVLKLVRYVRAKSAQKKIQFVVISLKESFYQNSDGLVGVCREPDSTSKTLTCDLENLPINVVELLPIKEQNKVDERVLSARKLKRQSLLPEFMLTSATETSATESSDQHDTDF